MRNQQTTTYRAVWGFSPKLPFPPSWPLPILPSLFFPGGLRKHWRYGPFLLGCLPQRKNTRTSLMTLLICKAKCAPGVSCKMNIPLACLQNLSNVVCISSEIILNTWEKIKYSGYVLAVLIFVIDKRVWLRWIMFILFEHEDEGTLGVCVIVSLWVQNGVFWRN